MKKINIFVFKVKNHLISIMLVIFTICLILFSSNNLIAAKSSLKLWANTVVPSLLPFFIATELLSKTDIPKILGKIFNFIMKPLFNISGEGSFAIIMGCISGYPVGAKIAVTLRNQNICSKEDCERLLSFTNNSGPLFIVGSVGIGLFGNSEIGFLLLITHLLSCFTVGIIFRFWKKNTVTMHCYGKTSKSENKLQKISIKALGEMLSESIYSSICTILMIGGFIVLFSVIISILNSSKIINLLLLAFSPVCKILNIKTEIINALFAGIIEVTNGISLIANIHLKHISINMILSGFLLGIGGISVFLQVLSIVSKSDLSIKPYIIGKLLHGFLAAFYTYFFINFFPFFNFNIY